MRDLSKMKKILQQVYVLLKLTAFVFGKSFLLAVYKESFL